MIHLAALLALALATAPSAGAADWSMDAASSRLAFVATFEGNAAPGEFRQFDVRVRFDADKPGNGRLDVTIVVKSADMNSMEVNDAIGGAEWFDFARFPQATFHASDIHRVEAGRYLATGPLTLKGVQKTVEVPFTWTEEGTSARMTGELTLVRGDFGIGTGQWASTRVIGAEVKISFDVRLHRHG